MKKSIILFAAGLSAVCGTLRAQEAGDIFTHKIGGGYEISLLSEGQGKGDPDILIGASPDMIRRTLPEGTFPIATNAFLVKTPEKTILVDAGYGRKLFDNLAALKVKPEDIDIVLLTHMHGDHTGGLLRNGKPAFPNAEIWLSWPEYDYWINEKGAAGVPEAKREAFRNAQDIIKKYDGRVFLFEPLMPGDDTSPLFPGVHAFAAYGHTPGHTVFLIGEDKQVLVWGDLTHAMAIQMPFPAVAITYDVNPGTAISSRMELLKYVAQNNIPVAGMHIAFPAMGRISATQNGGYRFIPLK